MFAKHFSNMQTYVVEYVSEYSSLGLLLHSLYRDWYLCSRKSVFIFNTSGQQYHVEGLWHMHCDYHMLL